MGEGTGATAPSVEAAGERPEGTVPARELQGPRQRVQTERDRILGDMSQSIQGAEHAHLRRSIRTASAGFSTAQLRRMRDQGVVFAGEGHAPADRRLAQAPSDRPFHGSTTVHGRYLAESRVVQLQNNASPAAAMHEMAHAWDDVSNDRTRLRSGHQTRAMTRLNHQDARGQAAALEHQAGSVDSPQGRAHLQQRARALRSAAGRGAAAFRSDSARYQPGGMTMHQMLDRYRGRVGRTQDDRARRAFDVSAHRGYSMQNAREFYAEGYAAFHGTNTESRRRLRAQAPELYRVLHREAQAQHNLPAGAPPPP